MALGLNARAGAFVGVAVGALVGVVVAVALAVGVTVAVAPTVGVTVEDGFTVGVVVDVAATLVAAALVAVGGTGVAVAGFKVAVALGAVVAVGVNVAVDTAGATGLAADVDVGVLDAGLDARAEFCPDSASNAIPASRTTLVTFKILLIIRFLQWCRKPSLYRLVPRNNLNPRGDILQHCGFCPIAARLYLISEYTASPPKPI